ncbi:YgfZ/GcvT domain-containing protein [Undibacterium sp. Ji83W]|uniref:CAF17-like 4Fe-4S cluster assembly/insertion protein YgfZ n=1 Tax=Undibacterium sp. Ji83W TaxID=3413043 RepID=UPI003BF2B7A2
MTWEDFLSSQGATVENLNTSGFTPHWQSDALQTGFIAPLTDLGLIRVTGEDAPSFLHNQLSNDVEHLGAGELRRAAYCTPKGRMLASFVYWKDGQDIIFQLSKTIQTTVQKRLQMFILREKAKLHDINAEYVVLGLGGTAVPAALQEWFPGLPAQIDQKLSNEYGSLLRVADANNAPRYQWIAPVEIAQQAWPKLSTQLRVVNTNAWRVTEIQAGIAIVIASTQEKFVPQMINFELIGGVNFKKGCYPGQEIVARSQYLGKLKRRMAIALVHAKDVIAGSEVFHSDDVSQPCGMIVNAEQHQEDCSLVLMEMKLADQESGQLTLGSATGAAIELLPLPYAITDITQ